MALFNREEIRKLEKVFGFLYSNDEERLAVIQCNKTKDIVACPGSGKTTCLAAKLYLLANRIPFRNGSGVCVLAHTNNTIDEITKKLGGKADLYTSYPNFLGTIQSFVDRFLAIPANIMYFSKRPEWIEHDRYENAILDFYYSFPPKSELGIREWAYAYSKNKGITPEEFILNLRYDLVNEKLVEDFYRRKNVRLNDANPKYKKCVEFKLNLLKKGILHYDDAYLLAEKYINEHSEILKSTFSERFKFAFIDEMQDTAKYQLEIIDKCFDDNVAIQRFGDPNQAIFNHTGDLKAEKDWVVRDNDPLRITSSKRFNKTIARVVNCLGIESYENPMCGEGEYEQEHAPVIITFKTNNIEETFAAFAKIIEEKELNRIDAEKRKPFKAVGWVAKERDDDKLKIGSYYKNYIQHKTKQKKEFDCLDGYVKVCEYLDIGKEGLKVFKDNIFRCLARALREGQCQFNSRYLTAAKLEETLHKNHRTSLLLLRQKIIEWSEAILRGSPIKDELKKFIKSNLSDLFEDFDSSNIQDFLTKEYEGKFNYTGKKSSVNKAVYNDIEIEISTIHSAKGQTHEATLYLETFYRKHDIEDILEFLKGNSISRDNIQDTQKCRLKMAYVGMSRPKSLLCIAVREEIVEEHKKDLRKAGWEIRSINEILKHENGQQIHTLDNENRNDQIISTG